MYEQEAHISPENASEYHVRGNYVVKQLKQTFRCFLAVWTKSPWVSENCSAISIYFRCGLTISKSAVLYVRYVEMNIDDENRAEKTLFDTIYLSFAILCAAFCTASLRSLAVYSHLHFLNSEFFKTRHNSRFLLKLKTVRECAALLRRKAEEKSIQQTAKVRIFHVIRCHTKSKRKKQCKSTQKM